MKNEIFCLHGEVRIIFNGVVVAGGWQEPGLAKAQLALLKSGYSVLTPTGGVKHVGAKSA